MSGSMSAAMAQLTTTSPRKTSPRKTSPRKSREGKTSPGRSSPSGGGKKDRVLPPPPPASIIGEGFAAELRKLGGLHKLDGDDERSVEEIRGEFVTAVNNTKRSLAERGRGLLLPKGSFVQTWDMVVGTGLLYTLFVTPFEVGMDLPTTLEGGLAILFVLNQLITLMFAADIVINFLLPFPVGFHGGYERRHSEIAKRYLTTWFPLDVITIIPFDVVSLAGALPPSSKSVKLLRVARLFKLAKVLRGSTIIQRWEHSIAIPSSRVALISYSLLAIVMLHWFACTWALIPRMQTPQIESYGITPKTLELELEKRANAMDDPTACTGCFSDDPSSAHHCISPCLSPCERATVAALTGHNRLYIDNNENWLCRAVEAGILPEGALDDGGAPGDVYAASLLVAILQLLGGVSTILPMNTIENIFFFVAVLAGAVLFAAVQGIICGVVTNGDPDETLWKQNNDALNFMMEDTHMPKAARIKVREYFQKSKKLFKRRSYGGLIDTCLSFEMQGDVRYLISYDVFDGIWWLKSLDRQFLEDLSIRLRRSAFAPKETITGDQLNILTHGMATRGGTFKSPGAWWGDVFLTSSKLRDTTPATCILYCEVARLTRYDLLEVAEQHPGVKGDLKRASLQLALQRTILLVALTAKTELMLGNVTRDTKSDTLAFNTASEDQPVTDAAAKASGGTAAANGKLPESSGGHPSSSVSALLESKLHATVGGEWREVEYDEQRRPIGIRVVEGKGKAIIEEDDASLGELLKAPKDSKDQMLTRMVYETNKKVDAMYEMIRSISEAADASQPSDGGGDRSNGKHGGSTRKLDPFAA